ncbi:hypothetical protein ABZ915_09000 [Streptomyces sp. NPDC046915]|uniref:hypothetical protein n=1 Tax=Streptomyces sp. NPDC046915 TaxID=3155257 RepID=UPI0033FB8B10
MGEPNTVPAAGVVLVRGRTRVWVERGALHWTRGRTTVTVPGARIRRVEVAGKSLTVALFEDQEADAAKTVRHRNETLVAALGAEIEAIMGDAGPSGDRQPLRRERVRAWPLRMLTGLRDRIRHGNPWWRRALWYVVLGLPTAVGVPVEPRYWLGPIAWLLLPASVALLRLWVDMAGLDTRWVMWRRGITVRARYEVDPYSEATHDYIVHFRTLDGEKITAHPEFRGRRDEIRYDPQDPSRVLAPTRVAWLGIALVAFMVTGFWGVVFGIPAVLWVIELLSLPF